MVKVLVIADEEDPTLHERRLRALAPELVLAAGDLPWSYLEWVVSTADVPMVFVPGNHDPELGGERVPGFADLCRWEGQRPYGAVNADVQVVEAAGLRIAGLGGCLRYSGGPHQYTQRQYRSRAARLLRRARARGPVDVLLTHAPPYGLGDEEDLPHQGIEALHGVLARLQPSWHLHGHVHPFGRRLPDREVGATTLRNCIPWRVLEITPRVGADVRSSA